MKKYIFILMVAMVNLLVISGYTGDKQATGKSRFQVIVSHTPEQCLSQLDKISAKGSDILNKFEWGCKSGNHTGYALIEADNDAAVKSMLPMEIQSDLRIVKVDKFTQADLQAIHEKMK